MRQFHQARLYPTRVQEDKLDFLLYVTRDLYNAALQQRRDVRLMRHRSVMREEQSAELTVLRRESPRLRACYRELEDAVLHRLDLAFVAFFSRIRRGQKPGYPRYKSASMWRQLEFPHGNRALKFDVDQKKVRIPGVGWVRLRKGRAIPTFGRAFLVRHNDRWDAIFECHREAQPLPSTGQRVGIDRGIRVLVALSDGERIPNPRHAEHRRQKVERHQRELERRTKRDKARRVTNKRNPKRKSAVKRLARAKEREKNARRDALHKLSRKLVLNYDGFAVEALQIRNMLRRAGGTVERPGRNVRAKAGLNRAIADAGWGLLLTLLREKAEYAAREVVEVPAKDTSRTCATCSLVAAESRVGPLFRCVGCGHEDDADVNAAKVILARAQFGARDKCATAGGRPVLPSAMRRGCTQRNERSVAGDG